MPQDHVRASDGVDVLLHYGLLIASVFFLVTWSPALALGCLGVSYVVKIALIVKLGIRWYVKRDGGAT